MSAHPSEGAFCAPGRLVEMPGGVAAARGAFCQQGGTTRASTLRLTHAASSSVRTRAASGVQLSPEGGEQAATCLVT